MKQTYRVKVNGKYWLCENLDKGKFVNGHYVEEQSTLVEDKSMATRFDYFELDKIKSKYGKEYQLEFEEVIKF